MSSFLSFILSLLFLLLKLISSFPLLYLNHLHLSFFSHFDCFLLLLFSYPSVSFQSSSIFFSPSSQFPSSLLLICRPPSIGTPSSILGPVFLLYILQLSSHCLRRVSSYLFSSLTFLFLWPAIFAVLSSSSSFPSGSPSSLRLPSSFLLRVIPLSPLPFASYLRPSVALHIHNITEFLLWDAAASSSSLSQCKHGTLLKWLSARAGH